MIADVPDNFFNQLFLAVETLLVAKQPDNPHGLFLQPFVDLGKRGELPQMMLNPFNTLNRRHFADRLDDHKQKQLQLELALGIVHRLQPCEQLDQHRQHLRGSSTAWPCTKTIPCKVLYTI